MGEGAGRRLHQAHQDGHRADHLLHGRLGHRPHRGRAQGRPRRRQGARLLRDRLDAGAGHRPARRQLRAPGRRLQRRAGDAGRRRRVRRRAPRTRATVEFILHIIPDSLVGAFAEGNILQVLLIVDPVRLRADGAGRARAHGAHARRRPRPRLLRRHRRDHEGGARSAPSAPWPTPSASTARRRSAISPA